jgi:predicted metal-dependent phosphoesterase TrpH
MIDLHMHTNESDGKLTFQELMDLAKKENLNTISITDHDSCKDVQEKLNYAKKIGLNYIPGIELSTYHMGKSVHVLGYFTDQSYLDPKLHELTDFIINSRLDRLAKYVKAIRDTYDIPITVEEVKSYASYIVARPHIAKAIMNHRPDLSHQDVFDKILGNDNPIYIPSVKIDTKEGIEFLKSLNCVVVLAHPTLLRFDIFESVIKLNFDGIEARYPLNKEGEEKIFRSIANKNKWVITGGSDYHAIDGDRKHGYIGTAVLSKEELLPFLNKVYKDNI